MYNIVICDDDETFVVDLENCIFFFGKERNIQIDIQTYSNAEELFAGLKEDHGVDIIFLDIEMGLISGVEAGRRIRQDMQNETIQIVYVSSKEGYAIQLFDTRPMNFLIKPVQYTKVAFVLDEYIRLYRKERRFFEYQLGKRKYRINEQSILYFQSFGKKIKMVLQNEIIEFYGKLSEIEATLEEENFCLIHKSFLVNMRYVKTYCYNEIQMTNGDLVPVSRSLKKHVSEKILEKKVRERG